MLIQMIRIKIRTNFRFATGMIVREYQPGDAMNITVEVTANHMGYFTFKMFRVREQNQDPDQECLIDQSIF